MQSAFYSQRTVPSPQYSPTQQADIARLNAINGLLVITLTLIVVGAIVGYRAHKATVLQRRVQRLNRIWQLDSSKNLP